MSSSWALWRRTRDSIDSITPLRLPREIAVGIRRGQPCRDALEQTGEVHEIERRQRVYLQGRVRVPLEGREVIVVDEGIATGASVRAALTALRRKKPKLLVLAIPVAPVSTLEALYSEVDEIICLKTPEPFHAIGLDYRDFHQVPDAEVVRLLAEAAAALNGSQP